jgi:hypothetical protein
MKATLSTATQVLSASSIAAVEDVIANFSGTACQCCMPICLSYGFFVKCTFEMRVDFNYLVNRVRQMGHYQQRE